jgi:hypothetical protein
VGATCNLPKSTEFVPEGGYRAQETPQAGNLSSIFRSAAVRRHKEAEKAVRLIAYTSGEIQPIARSRGMVVAKTQRPEAVVLDRMSAGVAEETIG